MSRKWSEKQAELIEKHIKERQSMPSERLLTILEWDPEFFELYLDFSAHPWKKGSLPSKVKELIYIAIDAATTHLYEPGIRTHIRRALDQGATKEEILEVFELVSVLGLHSCTVGIPALADEYDKWVTEKAK